MTLSVALVYPDLLGTYGDGGNATVLAQRLRWRGFEADVVTVPSSAPLPTSCEFYVIGGGEDQPQTAAASLLAAGGGLGKAVSGGAVVLAVCAGLQVLGQTFEGSDGKPRPGLGLLDCATSRSVQARAVGEILVQAGADWGSGLGTLSGFENHQGHTEVGKGSRPVGRVLRGVGNYVSGDEGAVTGRVWGTYMHGPVLARNPALADLLISWVVGPLAALDDRCPQALHDERARAALQEPVGARPSGGARGARATVDRLWGYWRHGQAGQRPVPDAHGRGDRPGRA